MADRYYAADGQSQTCGLDSLTTDEFLTLLGQRIRFHRTAERMSRKKLAEVSGVSERYLAQLEAGQGNMSIALLRKVTSAIGLPLNVLLADLEVDNETDKPENKDTAPAASNKSEPSKQNQVDTEEEQVAELS